MQSIDLTTQLTKAYKRRWELIFNRINLKKGTNFDFRDIAITIPKNLPQNNDDVVNTWMRLRGLISDSTIIDNLPFDLDPISEQNKIQEQNEQEFETQMTQAQAFNDFTNQGESSIIEQKGGNDNE
jgi:hypothetical protein